MELTTNARMGMVVLRLSTHEVGGITSLGEINHLPTHQGGVDGFGFIASGVHRGLGEVGLEPLVTVVGVVGELDDETGAVALCHPLVLGEVVDDRFDVVAEGLAVEVADELAAPVRELVPDANNPPGIGVVDFDFSDGQPRCVEKRPESFEDVVHLVTM